MHCTGCGKKLKLTTDKVAGIDRAACPSCALNFEVLGDPQDSITHIQVIPFDAEKEEDEDEDDPDD